MSFGQIAIMTFFAWTMAGLFAAFNVWAMMWLKPYLSKYRLDGDTIIVEYKGNVRRSAATKDKEGRLWFFPSYFGGRFEVIGDEHGMLRIDRRYLREYIDGEYFHLR